MLYQWHQQAGRVSGMGGCGCCVVMATFIIVSVSASLLLGYGHGKLVCLADNLVVSQFVINCVPLGMSYVTCKLA